MPTTKILPSEIIEMLSTLEITRESGLLINHEEYLFLTKALNELLKLITIL
ncbi:MAG: hypothetical protein K8R53_06140 [Bacteroidales bacterium]|nr:hypothetical protein [Bacteroidales bacterium]